MGFVLYQNGFVTVLKRQRRNKKLAQPEGLGIKR